jgi:hypothetical protein
MIAPVLEIPCCLRGNDEVVLASYGVNEDLEY